MANDLLKVIAGVDTHADTHHVAIITEHGKHVADQEFLAVGSGYRKIFAFITEFGPVLGVGIEGTGSYGAELSRVLTKEGLTVQEINRPNRQARRLRGKSDPLDAYQAAESVLAQRGTSTPKAKDGPVECLRVVRAARISAMKARTIAVNQIKGILVSAAEPLRSKYRGMSSVQLIPALERSRPAGTLTDPEYATAMVLKNLATRYRNLDREISQADDQLAEILAVHAPMLCDLPGVGTEVASQLLVTVGDNPERIGNEAQFAALTGTAPIPASSGKTTRHRLSHGGDRAANAAIHHVVVSRMATDQRTKDYVARRTEEGKSKKEIMRCLKRYVSREIYGQLTNPQPAPAISDLRPTRQQLGLTLQTAARHFATWPGTLSRIERGLSRDDALAHEYRSWLAEQNPAKDMS
ncbi:IS110 family RNA-guided transposase [Pseudarthrobacter raffinosi]|uniref:IS110 family transposase n=1 Tax=Pseudarthrobacter raffinosi TaxID=2953651 RepID=UPI00208FC6B5|nr:IS110 family transposase [Pseudarthrobacter sp. MDT3-28]MCO4236759.1 IS110 family transposase [Pseudarthrobacter sp. MDT3-28]